MYQKYFCGRSSVREHYGTAYTTALPILSFVAGKGEKKRGRQRKVGAKEREKK